MTLPSVLVLGHRFASLERERQVLAGVATVLDSNTLTPEQLEAAVHEASGILLGTRARVDASLIAKLDHCKVVARYGVGLDNIDIDECTRRGIIVVNVPEFCIHEVSDHAVTLLLAASRRIIAANRASRAGKWSMAVMEGVDRLANQTAGILGFGRIGQAAARKVRPFVQRVLAHDPFVPAELIASHGAEPVDFPTLLRASDYISIHCPLTPDTRHLFNAQTLSQMKRTAWLINTGRGEIVHEPDLIAALQAGTIGGAALDVLCKEPPAEDSPLLQLDNVILTPHVAYYSEVSLAELQTLAAEEARTVLSGGRPRWLVNPAAWQS